MSEQDKKRQDVLQRIQKRELELKSKKEERMTTSSNEKIEEDPAQFYKTFYELKNNISIAVDNLEQSQQQVQELQHLLNMSVHFLSPYDTRQADQVIKTLEADIEKIKKTLGEKKKFSFKRRVPKTPNTTPATPVNSTEARTQEQDTLSQMNGKTFDGVEGSLIIEPVDYSKDTSSLRVNPDDDIIISNCENAKIQFCCVSGAAYLKSLKNCTVLMGPISGSAFLQNCTNCTIVLASRQARIHTSTNCDFYLYTRSDPIIEHCSDVKFAPYDFDYENVDQHFKMAQFDRSKNEEWYKVKDFNWLKQEQSPNWSIMPESDRASFTFEK
ncbi:tubulin-specific chaperone C [Acrasis kona]|uniref:Tubulin-specific chaperone C n=1 Tax=Acrasis kona TaxID=1008807 RepID=A0AAW2ZQE5_9EUKA